MGTQKLQVITPPTPLTSTASLASSGIVLAGQFDNSTVLAPMVDIGLAPVFASGPTPGTGVVVKLYLVPYVNSTNAGTVNTTGPVLPVGTYVGNFAPTTSGTTVYLSIPRCYLSALKYDAYLVNQTGETINSWTLTFNPTDWQY